VRSEEEPPHERKEQARERRAADDASEVGPPFHPRHESLVGVVRRLADGVELLQRAPVTAAGVALTEDVGRGGTPPSPKSFSRS